MMRQVARIVRQVLEYALKFAARRILKRVTAWKVDKASLKLAVNTAIVLKTSLKVLAVEVIRVVLPRSIQSSWVWPKSLTYLLL